MDLLVLKEWVGKTGRSLYNISFQIKRTLSLLQYEYPLKSYENMFSHKYLQSKSREKDAKRFIVSPELMSFNKVK